MLLIDKKKERLIDLRGAAVEIRDSYQGARIIITKGNCEYELGYYEEKRSRKILEEICAAEMRGMRVFAMPKE